MKEYKRKAVILGIIIVSLTVIGGISSYLISLNKDKATATQIEVAQDNILSEEISIAAQTVAVDGDTVLETNTGNDAETNQDNGSTKENEINEQTDDNHIFTLDKAVAYSVCYMESEIFGEVTFALGFDSKDSFQIGLFKDDNLVYQIDTEFDAILGDSYTKSTLKPDFHAVSFEDVNADGLNDISVIIETYTNRYEYISFNFLQDKESNGFIFNTEFNEYLATKKPNFPVEIMSLEKFITDKPF